MQARASILFFTFFYLPELVTGPFIYGYIFSFPFSGAFKVGCKLDFRSRVERRKLVFKNGANWFCKNGRTCDKRISWFYILVWTTRLEIFLERAAFSIIDGIYFLPYFTNNKKSLRLNSRISRSVIYITFQMFSKACIYKPRNTKYLFNFKGGWLLKIGMQTYIFSIRMFRV